MGVLSSGVTTSGQLWVMPRLPFYLDCPGCPVLRLIKHSMWHWCCWSVALVALLLWLRHWSGGSKKEQMLPLDLVIWSNLVKILTFCVTIFTNIWSKCTPPLKNLLHLQKQRRGEGFWRPGRRFSSPPPPPSSPPPPPALLPRPPKNL